MESKPVEEMTHEERREFNIRRNEAMLRSLGIEVLKTEITAKTKPEKKNLPRSSISDITV